MNERAKPRSPSRESAQLVQTLAVLFGFGLVLVSPAWAERTPTPGELDARVRSVPYEADQVVRLTGEIGYELELVFEAGEHFAGLASGDLAGVDFIAQDEHLFLKPRAAGVSTNLTVLTDRRVYRFAYVTGCAGACLADGKSPGRQKESPVGGHGDAVDSERLLHAVVWSVRFVYPPKPAREETAVPQVLNERYQFCGARQLKPRRVFDDGVRTTIEFGDAQELPAVFVRNPDGSESLVNFTVVGTGLIVHRVVEHLILRRGSLTACLRNRGPADGTSRERRDFTAPPSEGGVRDDVSDRHRQDETGVPAAGAPGGAASRGGEEK